MKGNISPKGTKKSQLNVKIEESLHEELKIFSIRSKKKLNLVVEEAIRAQLEKDREDNREREAV